MTKEELKRIADFVKNGDFSEDAKSNFDNIMEGASDFYNSLINANDTRYVDTPEYYTRECIDGWLDEKLTDEEFSELSCRLSHMGSYDSDQILYEINDMRS